MTFCPLSWRNVSTYADATSIPAELFGGLGLAMFGIPVLCTVAAVVAFWFYPLRTKAARDGMYAAIEAKQAVEAASESASDTER